MERQKQLEERAKEEAAGSTGTAVCVKDVNRLESCNAGSSNTSKRNNIVAAVSIPTIVLSSGLCPWFTLASLTPQPFGFWTTPSGKGEKA